MKAAVFRGAGSPLSLEDVPTPMPQAGQMLLKVKRCGICGSDLHYTEPGTPTPVGAVMGHEFCGEVVDLGPGPAHGWKEGDRVVSLPFVGCGHCADCLRGESVWCRQVKSHVFGALSGGYGQFACVGTGGSVKLPDSVSWDEAALVEPLCVGLHGYRRARLEFGANVLVVGAGPVGLSVVIWARQMGARRVIVTARSTRGAAMAEALGADAFIPSDKDVKKEFRRICGAPPDAVFECVGQPGVLQQCISYAPARGQVVVLGACTKPDTIRPDQGISKELTLTFALGYALADFALAVERIAQGDIDPAKMITDRVGWDDFPQAFEALRERSNQCKVLLVHEP